MRNRKQLEVPAPLTRLGQRFSSWRKTRARGERIPAPLWDSAAKMAAKYGLNLAARTLKLDYGTDGDMHRLLSIFESPKNKRCPRLDASHVATTSGRERRIR